MEKYFGMHVLSQLVEGFRFRLLNRFVIIFQQGCVLAAAGCCAIQTRNIHVDNGTYEEEHYLLNQLMIYHATKILNSPVVIPPNKNKKPQVPSLLYTRILCTTLTKRHYSKFTVSPETIFLVLLQGDCKSSVEMK